jgi:glycosyltransferase involved in cell wall biosynthesis
MSHRVSLIIPIYNEALHLEVFLKKIDSLHLHYEKELILVDDGSTDGSDAILKSFVFQSSAICLYQTSNQGKGAALKRGIQAAHGTIIAIQDADFEYCMEEWESLLAPLIFDQYDVVFGNRFSRISWKDRLFHRSINWFLTFLSNLCNGLWISDMETGYKVFQARILKNMILESHRFGFEPEVTAKIAKISLKIKELPSQYQPRNYSEGKKIQWKDGIAAIWHILKFNFFRTRKNSFHREFLENLTEY